MKKLDKSKKILIFGRGQIGKMYQNYFSGRGIKSTLVSTDITDKRAVVLSIKKVKPDFVINAAAKTSLEWIEKNKLESLRINVLGADTVAGVCEEKDVFLLHLSSGCIFESKSPKDTKNENSIPEPASFYAWTKVWAENLITARKGLKYLILRPRQPVSSEVSEKNMLIKMLTFNKFVGDDGGWNSGTILEDMMWITEELLARGVKGILHVENEGWTTPYNIAKLLKKHINPSMKFKEITHAELDKMTPVKRVATVMDISKLKKLGIKPLNYEKRLEELIIKLGENLKKEGSREILRNTQKTSKQRTTTSSDWDELFK